MKLSDLRLNDSNPRQIKDERFEKLKQSISEFPKMFKLRPIIYDPATHEVLGGNMRFRALTELGYKDIPDEWVKPADELTTEELKRFVIVDNVSFGETDFDLIANEWDDMDLEDWGMENIPDIPNPEEDQGEFKAKFEIVITCKDERQLNELFYELKERELTVKVVGAKGN